MEILVAAFLPPLVVLLLARRSGDAEVRQAWRLFAALTIVWLAPCWITLSTNAPLDYLTGMEPWKALRAEGELDKNFLLNDVVLQLIPLREAARRSLAQGSMPFLNRFAGGGTPLWENMQAALLYPVNLLALPFSSFAWPLFGAAAKLLLAACGTYLFVRRLGPSHYAALVAAIAYSFGAFNVAYLLFPVTNVTALLPWLLLAIDRLLEHASAATIGAAIFVTWCVLVGGHPESVLHVALVAVPFALWRGWRAHRDSASGRRGAPGVRHGAAVPYVRLAAVAVVAAALAAPVLVPFALWLPHSERMATLSRSEHFLATAPFTFESFIPFAVPNYFGNPRVHNYRHPINFNELCTQYAGLVTLILAFTALRRKHAFWIVVALLATMLAIMPAPLIAVVKTLPLLNITANGRLRFVAAFSLAVLAAFGFDEASARRRTVAAGAIALLVIAVCVLSYPTFAQYGIRRLIFFTELAALAGAAAIAQRRRRALPFLLFLDLASVMLTYNPDLPRAFYYPRMPPIATMQQGTRPYRVVAIDRTMLPNAATMFALEEVRPHDPLAFAPYVDTLIASGLDRSDYFPRFKTMPPESLLRFLGVRYVLDGAQVHEVRNPRPRFWSDGASVELLRYDANGATLRVSAPHAITIESSELALPGWRLSENGVRRALAHTTPFVSWSAPAGVRTYRLQYVPLRLMESCAIAICGAIALLVWMRIVRNAHGRGAGH